MEERLVSHFLDGARIYLREVRRTDINENYYRWLNDPEVTRFLEVRFVPQSLERIHAFVERLNGKNDEILMAICLKDEHRHIGNIKIGPINWIHRSAELSLFIGEKDCWGNGYATEAIEALCAFAFGSLNLHKLTAGCYASNVGSRKAFEKAGFSKEGLRKGMFLVNHKPVDCILLGLLVNDYGERASHR